MRSLWLAALLTLTGCSGKIETGLEDTGPFDEDGDGANANEDCDDTNPDAFPGALEYCDGFDNDCDAETDERDAVDAPEWCPDADLDGYGVDEGCSHNCEYPGEGYADNADDCMDIDARVNPEGTEVCDPVSTDEDCNGLADDEDPGVDPTTLSEWYSDADGDGYGDGSAEASLLCDDPTTTADRYVENDDDCDDSSRRLNPDEDEEVGDGIDNDCDDRVDEDGDDGRLHFRYGYATDPEDYYTDVVFIADWSRQIDDCDACDWAFEVEFKYDEENSYDEYGFGLEDDFSWTLGWSSSYSEYLLYYFEGYGWYAIMSASFDESTGQLDFQYGTYQYPYYGYYFTYGWTGDAEIVVY